MALPDGTPGGDRQESRWRTMVVSLRYPDFRLVWIGSLSEHLGEMMRRMTVLWLVNEMTRSPLLLSIVGTIEGLALLVFPIIGGVVADRVNRRILLMTTLAVIASLAVILAVLVATGTIAIWHLIVIDVLTSANGIPSQSSSISCSESIATPTLPTSPVARGWSESYPIWVGKWKATLKPVCPCSYKYLYRLFVSSTVASPAYWRIVHNRVR